MRYRCVRFGIDRVEGTDEDCIERAEDILVTQKAPTTLFATKNDAATFLIEQAAAKKRYYGQMLKKQKDNHFRM